MTTIYQKIAVVCADTASGTSSVLKKLSMATAGGILIALGTVGTTQASTITLESATLGSTGQRGGTSISDNQFYGWRFQIDTTLQVTHIGGHLLGGVLYQGNLVRGYDIFGAIISLNSSDALPQGTPFLPEEVLATTILTTTFPSSEIFVPLSVTLTPGSYGLVFGSGLFGATGVGGMPNYSDQSDIPPTNIATYFWWNDGEGYNPPYWRNGNNGGTSRTRFLVRGEFVESVPEPAFTIGLLTLGALGVSSVVKKKPGA
ncbi:hypothetical protein [Coleofasciculus sp. G2-EDA-02]|uniref:hypothetical protein n=1 Tax=Coleofasciculus sp. G2-EDA-02 TaxID=3069529 RepID=UPI0032FCE74D